MNLYILKKKLKQNIIWMGSKKIKIYYEIWIQITYPMSMSPKEIKIKIKLYTTGIISF